MKTAIDYIRKITDDGTSIRLPSDESQQVTNRSGSGPFDFMSIVKYHSESRSEAKAKEAMLERITKLVMCVDTPEQFYRHAMKIVPKDFRNGEYVADEWGDLLDDLKIEADMAHYTTAYSERNFKGGAAAMAILEKRSKAWQKKSEVKVGGGAQAQQGNDGSGGGSGFRFIVEGGI